jgi:hypothetical protein
MRSEYVENAVYDSAIIDPGLAPDVGGQKRLNDRPFLVVEIKAHRTSLAIRFDSHDLDLERSFPP